MMAIFGRVGRTALSMSRRKFSLENGICGSGTRKGDRKECRVDEAVSVTSGRRSRWVWLGSIAGVLGGCGAILYWLDASAVKAMGMEIRLPDYPWSFNGVLASMDHAAVRRGWTVYRNVCRTCHSLSAVRFLDMVNVTHSLEEVKRIAAEFEVQDGPDSEGNYYTRPCKLTDKVPPPFPNEEAARAANGGAYPPDLTFMVFAVDNGINYVFALLTGFFDPPAGLELQEGQYFNIYFPGTLTSMPQMLSSGMVEYEDGTPASVSQMAKDVVEFLTWAAAPEHDTRKIMTLKSMGIFLILIVGLAHLNRRNWSHVRSRRLAFVPNAVTKPAKSPVTLFSEGGDRQSKRCSRNSVSNR